MSTHGTGTSNPQNFALHVKFKDEHGTLLTQMVDIMGSRSKPFTNGCKDGNTSPFPWMPDDVGHALQEHVEDFPLLRVADTTP